MRDMGWYAGFDDAAEFYGDPLFQTVWEAEGEIPHPAKDRQRLREEGLLS